jgi:leucyl aminopeptidase (aminopeptidase T)
VADARVERYAELLLDTCLGVQRGWQVLVWSTPWARPLLEEVLRQLAERGAYPLLRLTFGGGLVYHRAWLERAPLAVLAEPPSVDVHAFEHCDALLSIGAPDNTRGGAAVAGVGLGADIPADRARAVRQAYRDATSRINLEQIPRVPGGEFFLCPVETSADGTIAFGEFPAFWSGRELKGVRLRFSEGRVVEATAESGEAVLVETLATDPGARRIGELGIGCNPGIGRYLRNVYFDEKMNGTVHIALGRGFEQLGGTNDSGIHWDIVKDLRSGGRIELDGEVVQSDGVWRD